MIKPIMWAKIEIENKEWNRYEIYSIPQVGDEIYIVRGDGSESLIKVTKVRHLATRCGIPNLSEQGVYLSLKIWGEEIVDNTASLTNFI
ncbi:MAG: hypothetical protein ACHBN1_20835 [Heteroscytonema crispum UTEX LB 1556]